MSLRTELERLLGDSKARLLCCSILGMEDSYEIEQKVMGFCTKKLGSEVATCLSLGFSVGASFGLGLGDGRRVFVKFNRASDLVDLPAREAIARVQGALAGEGYPCPHVLLPPCQWGDLFVTVEAFVDAGEQKDAHDPLIREAMAAGLAELVSRTDPYRELPGFKTLPFMPGERLYPPPHNALFDFEKTAAGAGWIDEIADRARTTFLPATEDRVLGHADWSMKNMRFAGEKIAVVYDWDSLTLADELALAGMAAATFPTTWDIDVKLVPSPQESLAFVLAYQRHRGKRFSAPELRKISAAATYTIAYTARCEHALRANGSAQPGEFTRALASMAGDDYLNVS